MLENNDYIEKKIEGYSFTQLTYIGKDKIVNVPCDLKDDKGCYCDNKEIEEIVYANGNKIATNFFGCSKLKKIYFSETIEKIGDYGGCFAGCESLENFEVNPANSVYTAKNGMLFSKNKRKLIYCAPGIKGIVIIPNTVKEIGEYAFFDCKKIDGIVLPAGLSKIEDAAFEGCTSLKTINLPKKIKEIPDFCFEDCCCLETVDLCNVKYIGGASFRECKKLKMIITANVRSIGENAFANCDPTHFEFEEPADYLQVDNSYGQTIFGENIKVKNELRCYPNLPLNLFEKPELKLWLVMGFCSSPELYSGYIRKQYEKYAKSQKKRILNKAIKGGYDVVLKYYGEKKNEDTSHEIIENDKQVSLSMTAADAKKYFKYSKRKTGISINKFTGVNLRWKDPGHYDSYFMDGICNRLVLPDEIDGVTVVHIAHTMLPDNTVIICNELVFQKLKRTIRASTACAYLENATDFPLAEADAIKNYIMKYPSDIIEQLIKTGDVSAVARFMELIKVTPKLQEEMLEIANEKIEIKALILNQKNISEQTKKSTVRSQEDNDWLTDLFIGEKPLSVTELKKIWTFSTYTNPKDKTEQLIYLKRYKGLKTKVVVPGKFGKNRLGRIDRRLLEGHDNVTELILPEGEYEVDVSLENCKGLADANGYIVINAGNRSILTDYIGDNNINKMTLPEGITEIASYVFKGTSMREVIIPEGVETIGDGAFEKCAFMKKISLPKSIKEIGNYAFSDCASLNCIELPPELKIIRKGTFIWCYGLEKIIIPEGVKTIESEAFWCSNLKKVYIPDSVKEIGENAFQINDYLSAGLIEIHAASGSYAQKYAEDSGIKFVEE